MNNPNTVTIISFSYRHGLPEGANLAVDVRFLRNPFYVEALKHQTGQDTEAGEYIAADPAYPDFFAALKTFVTTLLPLYAKEGGLIAIGCTGGRHRSVLVAERLAAHVKAQGYSVSVTHRDME